jgi:hypothetical protein
MSRKRQNKGEKEGKEQRATKKLEKKRGKGNKNWNTKKGEKERNKRKEKRRKKGNKWWRTEDQGSFPNLTIRLISESESSMEVLQSQFDVHFVHYKSGFSFVWIHRIMEAM